MYRELFTTDGQRKYLTDDEIRRFIDTAEAQERGELSGRPRSFAETAIGWIRFLAGAVAFTVGVYYLANFENEALTSALSMAQTVVLLICILVFRRLAGREALTA